MYDSVSNNVEGYPGNYCLEQALATATKPLQWDVKGHIFITHPAGYYLKK